MQLIQGQIGQVPCQPVKGNDVHDMAMIVLTHTLSTIVEYVQHGL